MCRAVLLTWQWDSELLRRFHRRESRVCLILKRHLFTVRSSDGLVSLLLHNPNIAALACSTVRRELCGYIEDDLPLGLKSKISDHMETCDGCRVLRNDLNTTVRLLGDEGDLAPARSASASASVDRLLKVH